MGEPSMGEPGRLESVIDKSGQKTFDLPFREDHVGFVLGELWAAGANGGISRRVGETWVKLDSAAALFVATPRGAVVVGRPSTGANWDGKVLEPFTLPLAGVHVGVATGETVWLGGDQVVLRRE